METNDDEPTHVIYGLYALDDPDFRIRYVGQTIKTARQRLNRHFHAARSGSSWAVSRWIRAHGEQNIQTKVLECVSETGDLDAVEARWIAHLGTFVDGLNMRSSAEAGRTHDYQHGDEARAKMSAAWADEEARAERCNKIAQSNGGAANPRAKLTEAQVVEIKKLMFEGMSNYEVKQQFGIGPAGASDIRLGHLWKFVPQPVGPMPSGHRTRPVRAGRFTDAQIVEIRRRAASGERQTDLARELGISDPTISQIVRKKTYRTVG